MPVNLPSHRAAAPHPQDLDGRFAVLRRAMLAQLERSMALENHWLIYLLLGWELLAACVASHYLVEVAGMQYPHRWVYVALWAAQTVLALATIRLIRGRPRLEESPLKPLINRVWAVYLLLCWNVAVLNVLADLPVFVFLPVLATLSSFAFLVLAALASRRLGWAGLALFLTGILCARFAEHGFLIYGGGWFLVLQVLGLVFWRRRSLWLADVPHRNGVANGQAGAPMPVGSSGALPAPWHSTGRRDEV